MRNISTSMIAREHLRSPQAIVATINTSVSSLTARIIGDKEMKNQIINLDVVIGN